MTDSNIEMQPKAILTVAAVMDLMRKTLYQPEEVKDVVPEGAILVDGVVHCFGFHPQRIKDVKPEIDVLLSELPDNFFRDKGGGWSFLNACEDRHGNHWGEHPAIEALVCLGIAAGSADWMMKEFSEILPGGMPYFKIWPDQPIEQPQFDYFECHECGFDSVQKSDFDGTLECGMCAGDSGHYNIMKRRPARDTDKPEGFDARVKT